MRSTKSQDRRGGVAKYTEDMEQRVIKNKKFSGKFLSALMVSKITGYCFAHWNYKGERTDNPEYLNKNNQKP
jgi:hypothetical protein